MRCPLAPSQALPFCSLTFPPPYNLSPPPSSFHPSLLVSALSPPPCPSPPLSVSLPPSASSPPPPLLLPLPLAVSFPSSSAALPRWGRPYHQVPGLPQADEALRLGWTLLQEGSLQLREAGGEPAFLPQVLTLLDELDVDLRVRFVIFSHLTYGGDIQNFKASALL